MVAHDAAKAVEMMAKGLARSPIAAFVLSSHEGLGMVGGFIGASVIGGRSPEMTFPPVAVVLGCGMGTPLIDLTGSRYGSLTVTGRAINLARTSAFWHCVCDCGKTSIADGYKLRTGHSTTCGCGKVGNHRSHGLTRTHLYRCWTNMKSRCGNPNVKAFKSYGARGITVCPEWQNSFEAFSAWASASGYVEPLTIERLDNDNGYNPDNCTWIPLKQQWKNTRSVPKAPDGTPWCVIAAKNGICHGTMHSRVKNLGWSRERAATEPVRGK